MWIAGRRDSTLFGVVHDTTTKKFAGCACVLYCISLPDVVDKVVVVVLNCSLLRESCCPCDLQTHHKLYGVSWFLYSFE